MGFLRRLFGSDKEGDKGQYHDKDGIYFYVECDRCHSCVKVRADRRHDLNSTEDGYRWNKTIVDSRCFQRMSTVVYFDRSYNVVSAEIDDGQYITEEAYDAYLERTTRAAPAEDDAGSQEESLE